MKHIKIIHDRKNIPFEESNRLADFDRLLEEFQQKPRKKSTAWKRTFWIFAVLISAGIISFLIFQSFPEKEENPSVNTHLELPFQNELPLIESTIQEDESNQNSKDVLSAATPDENLKNPPTQNLSTQQKQPEKSFENNYMEARPIIGFPRLYQYFDENLVYPESLLDENIEGKVVLKFVIDTLGKPVDISVEVPLNDKLDNLALTIIENMPPWYPAERNGKPIPSTHRVPLNFQIEKQMEVK